ncbi:MAG: hypothetical protein ACRDTU_22240, partial [Micromonosporaceae bacterium]
VRTDEVPGEGLFRISERDAYRYGLPVSSEALTRDDNGDLVRRNDGSLVLRDDLETDAPAGRLKKLPSWLGRDAIGGAGPALVQHMSGVDQLRDEVVAQLTADGLLPEKDANGFPKLSSTPMVAAAQLANYEEVVSNLRADRLEAAYDRAAQDGIVLNLVRQRVGHAPEHVTLHVQLNQQWDDVEWLGHTDADIVVNLDIGADTLAHEGEESTSHSLTGSVALDGDVGDSSTTPGSGKGAAKGSLKRSSRWSIGDRAQHVTLVENQGRTAKFRAPQQLVVSRVEADGSLTELATQDGDVELLLPADVLPEDHGGQQPESAPKAPTSYRTLRRATLLHLSGDLWDQVRQALPSASRPGSAGFVHLSQFSDIRSLISHPEWLWSEYATDLAVDPRGASPTRSSLRIQGEPGPSEFLTMTPLLLGDINFTMGTSTVGVGQERTGQLGLEGRAGLQTGQDGPDSDLTPDGTALAGNLGGTGTFGSGSSRSQTQVYGRERLIIETGNAYLFEMSVDVALTGSEQPLVGKKLFRRQEDGTTTPARSEGHTVVYALPERVALQQYADGELALPLAQVADAIQRFAAGDLALDRELAASLLTAYQNQYAATSQPDPALPDDGFRNQHGLAVDLAERLTELARTRDPRLPGNAPDPGVVLVPDSVTDPSEVIDYLLERLNDPGQRLTVKLPEHLARALGETAFEYAELTDSNGRPLELAEEVVRQIEEVAPNAARRTPGLRQGVFGELAGRDWLGKFDDMLEPRGSTKSILVPIGRFFAERVTVRMTATIEGGELVGETDDVVLIDQVYGYVGDERSEHTSRSGTGTGTGLGTDGTDGTSSGHTPEGAVSTGRGHTARGGTTRTYTRIQGVASIKGADRVGQRLKVTVEVTRTRPFMTRAVLRVVDLLRGRHNTVASRELGGTAVRLVPKGLIEVGGSPDVGLAPTGPAETLPDPRTTTVEGLHSVESTHPGRLRDVIRARLGRRDMLGSDVDQRDEQLTKQLSALAQTAMLEKMSSPEGHVAARLTVPGSPDEVIEVRVRATYSDLRQVAPSREDTQLREVDRREDTSTQRSDRERALPTTRSIGDTQDPSSEAMPGQPESAISATEKFTSGEQASEHMDRGTGRRGEKSNFEEGTVDTIGVRTEYHVTIVKKKVERSGNEKTLRRVHLPYAAHGQAYLVVFQQALQAMRQRLDSTDSRTRWWLDETRDTGRLRGVLQRLARRDA